MPSEARLKKIWDLPVDKTLFYNNYFLKIVLPEKNDPPPFKHSKKIDPPLLESDIFLIPPHIQLAPPPGN